MVALEAKVINSVTKNKDIHVIFSQDEEIFGDYKDIVGEMKRYYNTYRAVPSIEHLQDKFKLLDVFDANAPTQTYMDDLREKYLNQRIETVMVRAADAMRDGRTGAGEILDKMNTSLAKLNRQTALSTGVDATDWESASEHFKKTKENYDSGMSGIQTGFKSIDTAYPTGMSPGHLIYAIGYSGRGKSWFTALLGIRAFLKNRRVLFISLEMTPEDMRNRIYTMMGEGVMDMSDLAIGNVDIDNFETWAKENLEGKTGFNIISAEGMSDVTPNWIRAKIDQYKPDLVIIDFLQLVSDNEKTSGMTVKMNNLAYELKGLAVSAHVPIIAVSAVTDDEGGRDSPPMLSQIAWSKSLEYSADMAFAVHRHDGSNAVEVVGRKNRHGHLFDFVFDVDFARGIWTERALNDNDE